MQNVEAIDELFMQTVASELDTARKEGNLDRRQRQEEYNAAHGITPTTISKDTTTPMVPSISATYAHSDKFNLRIHHSPARCRFY